MLSLLTLYISLCIFIFLTDLLFQLKKIFFNVYLFLRERETETETETEYEWGRGRERETQNPKQILGSELSAESPTWGSNSQTMTSWPEPKSLKQWSYPGTPQRTVFKLKTEKQKFSGKWKGTRVPKIAHREKDQIWGLSLPDFKTSESPEIKT